MTIIKFEKREYEVVRSCEHNNIKIDRANKQITCKDCDAVLDPFEAIMNYSDALEDYKRQLDDYLETTERSVAQYKIMERRIDKRKKTKCEHCKKMTDINIKEPTLWEIHDEMRKGGKR